MHYAVFVIHQIRSQVTKALWQEHSTQPVPGVQIVERGRKIHEEKKTRGDQRGKGHPRPPPLRFPGVQLNSLPTYRRALLSERLEQAIQYGPSKTTVLVVVVKQSFVIICAAGEAPDFGQVMYRSLERSPYDYRGASGNFGCTSNGTGHFGFSDQNIRDQLWSDHFGRSDRNVPFRLTKLFSPVLFFCILLTRIITKRGGLSPVCATEMLGIISKAREISEISNRNFC